MLWFLTVALDFMTHPYSNPAVPRSQPSRASAVPLGVVTHSHSEVRGELIASAFVPLIRSGFATLL